MSCRDTGRASVDDDAVTPAFFDPTGDGRSEVLTPRPWAASRWGEGKNLRGMAVSGALARAAEIAARSPDGDTARPARWRLDIFRPVAMAPCTTSTEIVRSGRRLRLVDAVLVQAGQVMARASATFLAPAAAARGVAWTPAEPPPTPPPPGLRSATEEPRLYASEGIGWTTTPDPHQHARRKMSWHLPIDVVAGEPASPFQAVAMAADVVSVVVNWGDTGLEFVNADVDVLLARLPSEREVGLATLHRVEHDGVSAGSATVFDRSGILGTASVSALATGQVVDPRTLGRRA